MRDRTSRHRSLAALAHAACAAVLLVACSDATDPRDDDWRSTFDVDPATLSSRGRNPYFVLVPGHRLRLAGPGEEVVITVLDETRRVDGVETRVVEERESKGGELVEVSRNYFAIDPVTADVYYFGEDVDDYRNGEIVGHSGVWLSGVDGAHFGLVMPGNARVGDKHYQEVAPGVAMDRAEITDVDATLETPLRTFSGVLSVEETSPLESGTSRKWYAKGIGMIGDDGLRVVEVETPTP